MDLNTAETEVQLAILQQKTLAISLDSVTYRFTETEEGEKVSSLKIIISFDYIDEFMEKISMLLNHWKTTTPSKYL